MGIIYWDTCVWIKHISGQRCDAFEKAGIDDVIRLADGNEIKLGCNIQRCISCTCSVEQKKKNKP